MRDVMSRKQAYSPIIEEIFHSKFVAGLREVDFERADIKRAADKIVPHPPLITGYSRFNFIRASVILNCQSTPRCLAFVLSAQMPNSLGNLASSPIRRSLKHWLVRQLSSHSAMFSQLPCFGV